MDNTNQSKSETIVVGESLPELTKHVTQRMINRWAEVSGDFNPLHVDPAFGETTIFRTNIAHGPLTLSFIIEMLSRWLKDGWFTGGRLYNVRLLSPVPPDTIVTVGGRVTNIDQEGGRKKIECEIWAKGPNNKLLVTGKASSKI